MRWPAGLRCCVTWTMVVWRSTPTIWTPVPADCRGTRNWLFLGRETAGLTAATIYTVIQSARLNDVDVLPYLTDVLRRLPAVAADDKAGIDEFLPDRWLAAHPQHRLVQRERESRQAQNRRKNRRAARRAASHA